jgi:hypothetical protein
MLIDITDTVIDMPRRGLLMGDPTEPDEPGRKYCPQCKRSKPATTGFFHRNDDTEDGFAKTCKACLDYDRKHATGTRHRSCYLESFSVQEGWESEADMLRWLSRVHHTVRAMACGVGMSLNGTQQALKRCCIHLQHEPRPLRFGCKGKIKNFALDEGWASEYQMLVTLVKAHHYPTVIATVVGVRLPAITTLLQAYGIEAEDGRKRGKKWSR